MIKNLLNLAKENNIELEIRKEREKTTSIETYNDRVNEYEAHDITTYSIKAIYNGKTIKIETENINDSNKIINIIKEQSKIIDNNDKDSLATTKEKLQSVKKEVEYDYQQIKNDMLSFIYLKEKYNTLVAISAAFGSVENEIGIYNTLGTDIEDFNNYNYCMAEVVLDFNGVNKTNYRYFYDKKYNKEKFKNLVEELIKEAIDKEKSDSLETKKYNILLDSRCTSQLLNHFSSIYMAEEINKNKSILTNKFNEKVFSDIITIVEDPTNENYIGKRIFDDEGTKTCYKEIIKDGVFVTKLYDNKSALKDNVKSTGNSFGTRNMYIVPGILDKDALLNKLDNGIYINSIEGLHAGVNKTTGDISLQAEGYIIENGKKKQSLNMIILSTNIFELFNNVIEVGNDLEFISKQGSAPSLLINDITIAGNK